MSDQAYHNALYQQQQLSAQQSCYAQNLYGYSGQQSAAEAATVTAEERKLYLLGKRYSRMDARLERRREQIRKRWGQRTLAIVAILCVPPIALAVAGGLWRIALAVILR